MGREQTVNVGGSRLQAAFLRELRQRGIFLRNFRATVDFPTVTLSHIVVDARGAVGTNGLELEACRISLSGPECQTWVPGFGGVETARAGTSTLRREHRHDGSLGAEWRSLGCSKSLGFFVHKAPTRHKACSTLTPNMEQRTAVSIRFWAVCWRQGKMNKSRGSHTQWGSRILGVGDARRCGVPSSRTKCGVETNGPESGHLARATRSRLQPLRGKIKNQTFASRQSFPAGMEEVHGKGLLELELELGVPSSSQAAPSQRHHNGQPGG